MQALETERLILRKATEEDMEDLYELYSQERVVELLPLALFTSLQDARDELIWYEKILEEGSGMRWVIEEKLSSKVIGTCGFLYYEKEHNRIEIGYDLHPSYWGKGYMTEALDTIIKYGFKDMNLNKIEAKAVVENSASAKVLVRLGFQQEGVLRQHEFEKGRYIDLAVYAILSEKYEESLRRNDSV